MTYRDQYGGEQPNYGHYPPQQYSDNVETNYNPYDNTQPHQTYDQSGYGYQDASFGGGGGGGYSGYKDEPVVAAGASKERDRSVFDADDYATKEKSLGPKTSSAMKRWRYEHQGDLWTKGGRGRCFGRFFCCTIMIFVFLFISIVLSLALWIRPPNVTISQISTPTIGSGIQLQSDGVQINLNVNVSVNNPNYFSVNFKEIAVDIFYPINNTHIGGGSLKNIDIKSNQQTNFTLPFSLNYTLSQDPSFKILTDLAGHCGLSGTTASDISVNYKITLDFRVLFIPIKPVINNTFNFACPLSADQIGELAKAAGIDLGGIIPLLAKFFLRG